jgi:hypothetical protein
MEEHVRDAALRPPPPPPLLALPSPCLKLLTASALPCFVHSSRTKVEGSKGVKVQSLSHTTLHKPINCVNQELCWCYQQHILF